MAMTANEYRYFVILTLLISPIVIFGLLYTNNSVTLPIFAGTPITIGLVLGVLQVMALSFYVFKKI